MCKRAECGSPQRLPRRRMPPLPPARADPALPEILQITEWGTAQAAYQRRDGLCWEGLTLSERTFPRLGGSVALAAIALQEVGMCLEELRQLPLVRQVGSCTERCRALCNSCCQRACRCASVGKAVTAMRYTLSYAADFRRYAFRRATVDVPVLFFPASPPPVMPPPPPLPLPRPPPPS